MQKIKTILIASGLLPGILTGFILFLIQLKGIYYPEFVWHCFLIICLTLIVSQFSFCLLLKKIIPEKNSFKMMFSKALLFSTFSALSLSLIIFVYFSYLSPGDVDTIIEKATTLQQQKMGNDYPTHEINSVISKINKPFLFSINPFLNYVLIGGVFAPFIGLLLRDKESDAKENLSELN